MSNKGDGSDILRTKSNRFSKYLMLWHLQQGWNRKSHKLAIKIFLIAQIVAQKNRRAGSRNLRLGWKQWARTDCLQGTIATRRFLRCLTLPHTHTMFSPKFTHTENREEWNDLDLSDVPTHNHTPTASWLTAVKRPNRPKVLTVTDHRIKLQSSRCAKAIHGRTTQRK